MPYVRSGVSFVASGALALSAFAAVLATPQAARAEKTAEQSKCEEEGGSWVDKGNGNTFCFKKLPPMSKADGPPSAGDCPAEGEAASVRACDHAINTKGTGAAGRAGPGGDCDDDADGVCGMAIKTKGTGAQ